MGSVGAGVKTTEDVQPLGPTDPNSEIPAKIDQQLFQRRVKLQGSSMDNKQHVTDKSFLCNPIIITTFCLSSTFPAPFPSYAAKTFAKQHGRSGRSICGEVPGDRSTSPDLPRIGE